MAESAKNWHLWYCGSPTPLVNHDFFMQLGAIKPLVVVDCSPPYSQQPNYKDFLPHFRHVKIQDLSQYKIQSIVYNNLKSFCPMSPCWILHHKSFSYSAYNVAVNDTHFQLGLRPFLNSTFFIAKAGWHFLALYSLPPDYFSYNNNFLDLECRRLNSQGNNCLLIHFLLAKALQGSLHHCL